MKKALVLLFTLTLLFCSCESENAISFDDVFYPCMANVRYENGSMTFLAKLNVLDGSFTPLCTDPLCDHSQESGCPLFGYKDGVVYHGTLYFTAQPDPFDHDRVELRAYDFETGAVRLVCALPGTTGSGGGSYGYHGGYYCVNWESSDLDFSLHYTVELESGKITEYEEQTPTFPSCTYKKKPLSVVMEEDGLHGTILLGEKTLYQGELAIAFTDQITDGKLLYGVYHRSEDGRVNFDEMTLYTLDLDSGKSVLFCECFNDVYFAQVGDWIYYTRYEENPPVIGFDKNQNQDAVNKRSGNIWRMNIETGEEEKFLTLPQFRFTIDIAAVGDRVVLCYKNTDYSVWEEIPDPRGGVWYEYPETCGWLIVNPEDGTWLDAPAELDGKMCRHTEAIW